MDLAGEGSMIDSSAPIVTTFLVYVAAMIGTGVWAYTRTHTFADFALGSRRLSPFVAALSAGAATCPAGCSSPCPERCTRPA